MGVRKWNSENVVSYSGGRCVRLRLLTIAATAAERTLAGAVLQAGHDLVLADVAVAHQQHFQQVVVVFGHVWSL